MADPPPLARPVIGPQVRPVAIIGRSDPPRLGRPAQSWPDHFDRGLRTVESCQRLLSRLDYLPRCACVADICRRLLPVLDYFSRRLLVGLLVDVVFSL